MRKKFRLWINSLLIKAVARIYSKENDLEYEERLSCVRGFVHTTLPSIVPQFNGKHIIEEGKYNLFVLPSGSLPRIEFVYPELFLYILVPNITSASWPIAQSRGVTRDDWESGQADISYTMANLKEMAFPSQGDIFPAKVLLINWEDPINHHSLLNRVKNLYPDPDPALEEEFNWEEELVV